MFKRMALAAALLCAPLAGCGTVTDLLTNASTATPTVVNSAKGANDAFTFMANGADTYVKVVHPPASVVQKIELYRIGLKTELDKINADVAAGKSPVFDLFNDALKSWADYNTEQGVQS